MENFTQLSELLKTAKPDENGNLLIAPAPGKGLSNMVAVVDDTIGVLVVPTAPCSIEILDEQVSDTTEGDM